MRNNYKYTDQAGNPAPATLIIDGRLVVNPTKRQYLNAGYQPATPRTPTEQEQRQARIDQLHQLLTDTDYQVIKNAEATAAGQEPPYDTAQLHAQRQAWRDELNALESPTND